MENSSRVKQLKLAIAESQKQLMELQKDLPQPTHKNQPTTLAQMVSDPPSIQTTTSFSLLTVTIPSSTSVGNSAAILANGTSPVTLLDLLLGGYLQGAALHAPVSNPDKVLIPQQAVQESRIFFNPSQLAKSEQILRTVDFIDKIVPTVEDRTLSELGARK